MPLRQQRDVLQPLQRVTSAGPSQDSGVKETSKKDQAASTLSLIRDLSDNVKKKYPSALISIIITAVLALGEEYFVEFQYTCPCLTKEECTTGRTAGRIAYSLLPVIFSTIVIFVLGFFATATIKCVKDKEQYKHGVTLGDSCFWTVQALVISLAWFCILIIDGDYFACVFTCNAYGNTTCEEVDAVADKKDLPFSDEYQHAKETSQWVGYCLTVIPLVLFGLINFTKFECDRCQKGCCDCCGVEFDKDLSSSNERKIDENTKKAFNQLKGVVIEEANKYINGKNNAAYEGTEENRV